MTERPTPEQIADEIGVYGLNLLAQLDHHGYVIVHPDDVPVAFPAPEGLFGCTYEEAYEFGCRKMRSHIFGDDS